MGEAFITRRGGGVPDVIFTSADMSDSRSVSVSGLSDEKRYLVSAARYASYDTLVRNAIGMWYLDRGELISQGGMHYANTYDNVYSIKSGVVGTMSYNAGTLQYYSDQSDRVSLVVVEIG